MLSVKRDSDVIETDQTEDNSINTSLILSGLKYIGNRTMDLEGSVTKILEETEKVLGKEKLYLSSHTANQ